MWKWLKRKKVPEKERKKPGVNVTSVIQKHKIRIGNLEEELEVCLANLKTLHLDNEMPSSMINKKSSAIITRMTFIKYEIGIREDIIKWL